MLSALKFNNIFLNFEINKGGVLPPPDDYEKNMKKTYSLKKFLNSVQMRSKLRPDNFRKFPQE